MSDIHKTIVNRFININISIECKQCQYSAQNSHKSLIMGFTYANKNARLINKKMEKGELEKTGLIKEDM